MRISVGSGLVATSFSTLPRFRLMRAASVAQAVEALASDPGASVLAGGTDLPAKFNEGFAPSTMVDISRIEDLRRIEHVDGTLRIGAAVTHASGAGHPLTRALLPSFGLAWSRIANVRVRMSATLGGNLMGRRTRYEGAILLAALGARLQLATRDGPIEAAAEDCFTLPTGALLTAIVIPLRPGLRLDYERSMRPIMTQAVGLDATGTGRIVTATEFVRPRVRGLTADAVDADGAVAPPFDDPVTGSAYIERMSRVFLARQLERLRAAA